MMEELLEAASRVHDELGGGFTETVYHSALERELSERGVAFHSDETIPVMYRGAPVGQRRPDFLLVGDDGLIVVELKAGSTSGTAQLSQYIGMTTHDDNLGEIIGGAVIRFNDDLDYECFEPMEES